MLRRILVTGAAGFVGGYAIKALAREFPESEIIDAGFAGDSSSAFRFDITDRTATNNAIRRVMPDGILHLAAVSNPAQAHQNARAAWDVNFTGTMNVVEAALARDPATRIVFAGSSECYGATFLEARGRPVREDAALNPLNVYGATKAAADIYLGQLASAGAQIVRFRPFNHTGPGQSAAFVVPGFAQQIAAAEAGRRPSIINVGNLDVERDLLDVRDVARAYALAFRYEPGKRDPTVFNLSTGVSHRIGALLETLIKKAAIEISVQIDPERVRHNDIPIICGDATNAATYLGWRAEIPIETTLADVLDYWRESERR